MVSIFYICSMRKKHLIVAGLAFLMCLLSAYFGVRIQNANSNFLLEELNAIDQIYYADVNEVPRITFQAAVITSPLILAIIVTQILIILKTPLRVNKNIAIGLLVASISILTVDFITLLSPQTMDFSQWGYVWVCMGLFLIAGNILSIFIQKFSKS